MVDMEVPLLILSSQAWLAHETHTSKRPRLAHFTCAVKVLGVAQNSLWQERTQSQMLHHIVWFDKHKYIQKVDMPANNQKNTTVTAWIQKNQRKTMFLPWQTNSHVKIAQPKKSFNIGWKKLFQKNRFRKFLFDACRRWLFARASAFSKTNFPRNGRRRVNVFKTTQAFTCFFMLQRDWLPNCPV